MLTCDCGAIAKMTKTDLSAPGIEWTDHRVVCKACGRTQKAPYLYERNAVFAWNAKTKERMKKNLAALDRRVNNAKG